MRSTEIRNSSALHIQVFTPDVRIF
jgi:hypothetical protein